MLTKGDYLAFLIAAACIFAVTVMLAYALDSGAML